VRAQDVIDLSPLEVGALRVDRASRLVTIAGRPVPGLTCTEYALLVYLAVQPTRVYEKAELLREVWGWQVTRGQRLPTRTVDTHACRLRGKLTAAGAAGLIRNVRAVGYRLCDPEPLAVAA
jgi:DNA-binding response OmpR family regulator